MTSAPAGGSSLDSGSLDSGGAGGKLGDPELARMAAIVAGQGATGGGGAGGFRSLGAPTTTLDGGSPAVGDGSPIQNDDGIPTESPDRRNSDFVAGMDKKHDRYTPIKRPPPPNDGDTNPSRTLQFFGGVMMITGGVAAAVETGGAAAAFSWAAAAKGFDDVQAAVRGQETAVYQAGRAAGLSDANARRVDMAATMIDAPVGVINAAKGMVPGQSSVILLEAGKIAGEATEQVAKKPGGIVATVGKKLNNNPATKQGLFKFAEEEATALGSGNPYLAGKTPLSGTRGTGVSRAAKAEVDMVRRTGQGTIEGGWTPAEVEFIKAEGRLPAGIVGHHINNVDKFPGWAGDPRNIKFVRGQAGNLLEHGGNFQRPTTGPLIDR